MNDPTPRVVRIQIRIAFSCVILAVFAGMLTVLHYIAPASDDLHALGASMQRMRPMHTTFASAWIYAGCLAVIYHYLGTHHGGLSRGDHLRFKAHTWLWVIAGAGFVYTMLGNHFTGREYLAFHPILAGILVLGWLLFAFSFLRRLRHGFWGQPIYIYFWTIGTLYFLYTFLEGHAHYLFAALQDKPTHDLAVQWKSCGTLVGSFNFLVYGCLVYVGEKVSGDKTYGQSKLAFALFGVGCLNSFTNFAHHTYHIPQDDTIKWIAFVVSMAEALIFLRLMFDLTKAVIQRSRPDNSTAVFFSAAKWWSCVMIFLGIVISVPQLNSYLHGTHVIAGHAMGTELGIDTLVLFGALTYLLSQVGGNQSKITARLNGPHVRRQNFILNFAMVVLVAWLHIAGTFQGVTRYYGESLPLWVAHGTTYLFPVFGFILALVLLHLCISWLRLSSSKP